MSLAGLPILLLAALLSGCAKPAVSANAAKGYEYEYSEPRAETEEPYAASKCERGGCELETPPGRIRVDLCEDCPAPYTCYLNPLVDVRLLPGADPRPRDFFECSKPAEGNLSAELGAAGPLPPPRSCPRSQRRYWLRNGARFACCLFNEPVAVQCHAE